MRLDLSPLGPADIAVLPPDIVWTNPAGLPLPARPGATVGTVGDFVLETDPAYNGVGGFQARNPIESAVIMLLFSDARCAVSQLKIGLNGDRRGWVGDGFDVDTDNGEAPLGSLLWLDRRAALTEVNPAMIAATAKTALQPLIVQQVCAQIAVSASFLNQALGIVTLDTVLTGRDGRQVYARKFGPLWARTQGT